MGGVAPNTWASIRLGATGVVAVAVAVAVRPLCLIARVRVLVVAPSVLVTVRAAVGAVLPRLAVGGRASIRKRAGRVVAVAVAVGVVPLGVVGHERICAVGRGPSAVGVGVAITVLVGASLAVMNRGAKEGRTVVVQAVIVTVAVNVAPAGGVVGVCVGAVVHGPATVGVGVAVAVGVRATSAVGR